MKRLYFIFAIVLGSAAFLVTAVVYPQLPAQIPTHWNIHGNVDDYGAKTWAAFLMPAVMLGLLGLFSLLNWLSPRQFKLDTFRSTWEFLLFLLTAMLFYFHLLMLWVSLGWSLDMNRAMMGGLFLFLALFGNVLGKVRRNFWIGVRTPWTLASERVWNDTHRVAARVFVIAGILGFIAAMIGVTPVLSIAILIAAAVITVGYSLVDYKRLERRGEV